MALSYNLGYQESISVHLLQGVRILLANHTRISPTSENDSYLSQVNLPSSQKQAPGNLIWSPNETIKVSQLRGVNPIYVVENLEIKTLNMKENSMSSI